MMTEIELIYREPLISEYFDCFWCRETQSTMLLASLMYSNSRIAVRTDSQKSGRGRGSGRRWHASAGRNLLCTMAFPLEDVRIPLQLIPLAAGCAAADAVESAVPGMIAQVKWPNDLMVSDKKTAGILCETRRMCTFIGIGLNVNEEAFFFSGKTTPTSLYLETGCRFDVRDVYCMLLERLPSWLSQNNCAERIASRLYGMGSKALVSVGTAGSDDVKQGIVAGIADDGALLLDTPGGRLTIYTGEIISLL